MKRTFTTTLMALLLCVCMVLGLTACGGFTQDDIDNAVNEATAPLNEQIAALEADIAEKTAKITTLEGEKTALTTEKTTLTAKVTELEGEIDDLEEQIAALEADADADGAEIAKLKADVEDLTSAKADLEDQITTLNGRIAEKDTQIAELNSSIDTLTAEKQTLTDKVAELEGKNEQLEAEKEALKNCLAGKHVIDTEGEISYAWSKDYSTCTATGVCVHCDGATTEVANGVTDDDKITATFENPALGAQAVHTATTYDELNTLLQSGEAVTIRLGATLNNIQSLYCGYGTTAVLDMNGNDITFEAGCDLCVDSASLTLKGKGTITASGTAAVYCRRSLSIEDNVTVNGSWYAINIGGSADKAATIIISGGTINAQGSGRNFNFCNDYISLTITGGTFSCDPTAYVDTEKYEATENGDGTYTVSCNHKDSAHTATFDLGDDTHGFICTVCGGIAKESHSLITIDKGNGTHSNNCTVCDSKSTEKHSYGDNDECACGAKIAVVTTAEELLEALANGGDIKLGADIELTSRPIIKSDVSIDLNGKTLTRTTGNIMYIDPGYTVSISNGNIVSTDVVLENYGTLTVDNCTVTGFKSLDNAAGTTTVTSSTLNGIVENRSGTTTLYGSVTLGAGVYGDIGLASYGGSIVCYFDPSDMLYTAYGDSDVTDNGDGTWTVTKAE